MHVTTRLLQHVIKIHRIHTHTEFLCDGCLTKGLHRKLLLCITWVVWICPWKRDFTRFFSSGRESFKNGFKNQDRSNSRLNGCSSQKLPSPTSGVLQLAVSSANHYNPVDLASLWSATPEHLLSSLIYYTGQWVTASVSQHADLKQSSRRLLCRLDLSGRSWRDQPWRRQHDRRWTVILCSPLAPRSLQVSEPATSTQPFHDPLGFCLGLPRWAGTRKVKPMWIYWSKSNRQTTTTTTTTTRSKIQVKSCIFLYTYLKKCFTVHCMVCFCQGEAMKELGVWTPTLPPRPSMGFAHNQWELFR